MRVCHVCVLACVCVPGVCVRACTLRTLCTGAILLELFTASKGGFRAYLCSFMVCVVDVFYAPL